MKHIIQKQLQEIEKEYNIQVLHAVESGSRAWGFASPDSDYDVRFIYIHPIEHYLKLERTRDVIELPINNLLDVNGWDLQKTLRLLRASNPSVFEWFKSPIVYKETKFSKQFISIMEKYFLAKNGLYHYLHMAEGNYREYLKADMVKVKKYFYVLRPLLACGWILEHNTPPPMKFKTLMDSQLPKHLCDTVNDLLNIKINTPELKVIPRVDLINDYFESELGKIKNKVDAMPSIKRNNYDELDDFFVECLYERKKMTVEQYNMINELIVRKLVKLGKEFKHYTNADTYTPIVKLHCLNDKVYNTLKLFKDYNLENGKSCQWVENQIKEKTPIFYNYYYYDFE